MTTTATRRVMRAICRKRTPGVGRRAARRSVQRPDCDLPTRVLSAVALLAIALAVQYRAPASAVPGALRRKGVCRPTAVVTTRDAPRRLRGKTSACYEAS